MGFQGYITLDKSTPSRSGKYAVNLPGVSLSLVESLTGDEQEDYLEMWDQIYERACDNMVQDVTTSMQKKFRVEAKLATRESSQFTDEWNDGTGLAGLTLRFNLPKYAQIHIISVEVQAEAPHTTPPFAFNIYQKDASGKILHNGIEAIGAGTTVIDVDKDFEVDQLFIAYNKASFSLSATENKHFKSSGYLYDKLACTFPCGCGSEYSGYVRQENGGGLNVKFVVKCSVRKFVLENLPLFQNVLLQSIGKSIVEERLYNDRLSRFTTMTTADMDRLEEKFTADFDKQLSNVVDGLRVPEDNICFICEGAGRVETNLP